jgi:PAS domain-containing protein
MVRLHEEHLRSGKGYTIDYRLIDPDGGVRTMRGTVEFGYDASGVLVRMIGVLQDLTSPKAVPGSSGAFPSTVRVDPPAAVTE